MSQHENGRFPTRQFTFTKEALSTSGKRVALATALWRNKDLGAVLVTPDSHTDISDRLSTARYLPRGPRKRFFRQIVTSLNKTDHITIRDISVNRVSLQNPDMHEATRIISKAAQTPEVEVFCEQKTPTDVYNSDFIPEEEIKRARNSIEAMAISVQPVKDDDITSYVVVEEFPAQAVSIPVTHLSNTLINFIHGIKAIDKLVKK